MNKQQIELLAKHYLSDPISLKDVFDLAIENIGVIRPSSSVDPCKQLSIRAKNLATPLTIVLINLSKMLNSI